MTNTNKPNQQDVLDYVNNPENLKKAAEGSMEKRQAVFDRSEQTDWLRDFLVDGGYRLDTDSGTMRTVVDLVSLFNNQLEQSTRELQTKVKAQEMFTHKAIELAKREAKIREIKVMKRARYNSSYETFEKNADNRLSELTKQKEELLNEN